MKFEVGDLVQNYIGDLLITVDVGAWRNQYATFHNVDGQEYTIWAHHANWKQHKVVAKAKKNV
jgi:hypothetical protein